MKLIALKHFSKIPAMAEVEIENQHHPLHVHKGAQFEIGKADTLKGLSNEDRHTVALLATSGCVDEPTPELVARINQEIEIDTKREASHKAQTQEAITKGATADLLSALQRVLSGLKPAR